MLLSDSLASLTQMYVNSITCSVLFEGYLST
jgi:hypothetical protein